MKYQDLREFISVLESAGELHRIKIPISPYLEMTEISERTLRVAGPALLFEQPSGFNIPVLANLFGTTKRVAMAMGQQDVTALREIGLMLAALKEPAPPQGIKDAWSKIPFIKKSATI